MMIVRRRAYLAVGGFDAKRYPTSYNDVDLWLRLGDAGYRCLFNPAVQAKHEESKTRGVCDQEFEFRRRLQEDLQRRGWRDPFWNLALFRKPGRSASEREFWNLDHREAAESSAAGRTTSREAARLRTHLQSSGTAFVRAPRRRLEQARVANRWRLISAAAHMAGKALVAWNRNWSGKHRAASTPECDSALFRQGSGRWPACIAR